MVIEINTLNFALGACFLQKHQNRQHPVAYYSQKITLPELNYNIYNKELLGIVTALKEQRAFLQGTKKPFIVKIDYKNLIEFLITKELNQKQVRQAEILIEYYFKIQHTKGTDNARADALSRKAKLQNNNKLSGALLQKDIDRLIRYNYLKVIATKERQVYKLLESNQLQKI